MRSNGTNNSRSRKFGDLPHKELINRLGAHPQDEALFGEFYHRFNGYICNVVIKTCANVRLKRSIQADDVTQEVYQKLFEREAKVLRSFKSDNKYAAFTLLGLIARQTVLSHYDKHPETDISALLDTLAIQFDTNGFSGSEISEALNDCIQRVTAKRRHGKRDKIIFWLKADGVHSATIAEWLSDLSESRINNIYTEFGKSLAKCLSRKGTHPPLRNNSRKV